MAEPDQLVKIVEVRCPTCGPKAGIWTPNGVVDLPALASLKQVNSTKPVCFECKARGRTERLIVIMEGAGEE